jgi:hypothetical protein
MGLQLSEHFSQAELTTTETGHDNAPNATELEVLRTLATFLEKVRTILGNKPLTVHSAFRSHRVNQAVGGVPNRRDPADAGVIRGFSVSRGGGERRWRGSRTTGRTFSASRSR